MPEGRRLLDTLLRSPRPDLDHAAEWSWWSANGAGPSPLRRYRARGQAPP